MSHKENKKGKYIQFLAVLFWNLGSALMADSEEKQTFYASEPVTPGISQPVREILPDFGPWSDEKIPNRINPLIHEPDQGKRGTWNRKETPIDPLAPDSVNPSVLTPTPDFTFEGTSNPTGCGGCTPPDTVGDASPNHYIQMVNATKVAIYNKTGTLLSGPFNLGTLFSGGNCTGNDGDPVVLYDGIADRWLLSQFAGPNHMCVAISQTSNPTGSYFTYEFNVGSFPDYFKFGVWPDAYYMSANENTYTAYAFDRTKMLAGQAATFQKFTGETNFLLPSDVDGSTLPPAGAPNVFYTFKDNSFHGGNDRIVVKEFHVDWMTPANSTFITVANINITSFTYTACGFFNFDCVRQQGTMLRVDALSEWPMFRFPYRNFGTHQTLIGVFTVGGAINGPGGTGEVGGAPRWFELRNTGGGWTLFQEGTYDPADGHDRFMASIAMDGSGNIALGYSVSSSAMFPNIRYATRLAGDPVGTLGAEQTIMAGGGSQTGSNRWGDYSAMSVDPADDCRFWYTNEYYSSNSATSWKTRIGVFKAVASCSTTAPDLTIIKDDGGVSVNLGGNITYTLTYGNVGTTDSTGVQIQDVVPANTTFNSGASTPGWGCVPNNNAGSTCTFVVGSLASGSTGNTVQFVVTVNNSVPPGVTQINNTATIADDGSSGGDLNPGNNSDSDSTPILGIVCLFCDDFENGVLSTQWTYEKLAWSESGGDLIGTPDSRKAIAIATPIFSGCSLCSVAAGMSTAGGPSNKLTLYGWRMDKDNLVEVIMKEEKDKWVLRQRVNGSTVGSAKGLATIDPNVNYDVLVTFDGTTFTLSVGGTPVATLPAVGMPSGTVGFVVKKTIGNFEYISVN